MGTTSAKILAEYQKRLADQVELALSSVERLDWFKQLGNQDKAHVLDVLFNRQSELQMIDGTLAVPTLDPTTRLLLRFASLLTAYELMITQLTEAQLSRGQAHKLRKDLHLPGRDF